MFYVKKTYVMRVCSTKGGVGKTTVAINLATAMQLRGYNVLIVDADSINPCVGLYMGLQDVNVGTFEAMRGKVDVRRAIIPHPVTGLHILPGKTGSEDTKYTKAQVSRFFKTIIALGYDFIIVDTQPGIMFPNNLDAYDEGLIVTLPFEASCLSALKMSQLYSKTGLKTNVVANMVRGRRYELSLRDIEELTENHVIASLPEDEKVDVSIAEHIPIYLYDKKVRFSKAITDLADVYTSRVALDREAPAYKGRGFFSWFRRNRG